MEVYCKFNHGNGSTEVLHNSEELMVIDKCDNERCFQRTINYTMSLSQIEALKMMSENCEQSLNFGCFSAPLFFNSKALGEWKDIDGNFYGFYQKKFLTASST